MRNPFSDEPMSWLFLAFPFVWALMLLHWSLKPGPQENAPPQQAPLVVAEVQKVDIEKDLQRTLRERAIHELLSKLRQ